MNREIPVLIAIGVIGVFAISAGVSVVFATTNTYNCTLTGSSHCGKSYTAYSFQSNINSNSEDVLVCAGYQIGSGNPVCTSIYTGQGDGFTGSSSVSFNSYYKNTSPYTTIVSVSDVYCNCFSPSR